MTMTSELPRTINFQVKDPITIFKFFKLRDIITKDRRSKGSSDSYFISYANAFKNIVDHLFEVESRSETKPLKILKEESIKNIRNYMELRLNLTEKKELKKKSTKDLMTQSLQNLVKNKKRGDNNSTRN